MGAYSRLGAYQIFTIFSKCSMFILQQIKKGNNKTRRCNKARFLSNTVKKTPSSAKSVISTYSFLLGGRGKGVGF